MNIQVSRYYVQIYNVQYFHNFLESMIFLLGTKTFIHWQFGTIMVKKTKAS